MSNADINTSKSTDGQTLAITSLSNTMELLTKLEALYTQVRTVEKQATQEVWGLLLSEQAGRVEDSLLRLASSVCGSMDNMERYQSNLTATIKQLNAQVKSLNKLKGVE